MCTVLDRGQKSRIAVHMIPEQQRTRTRLFIIADMLYQVGDEEKEKSRYTSSLRRLNVPNVQGEGLLERVSFIECILSLPACNPDVIRCGSDESRAIWRELISPMQLL